MFITCVLNAQMHVEYVSEKSDSMALLNKKDVDVINNVFSERNSLDSLTKINEQIILNLEQENQIKDSIIFKQIQTIENDQIIVQELEQRNNQTLEVYTRELKKEKRKKISFQTLTGAGIIAIILLILV